MISRSLLLLERVKAWKEGLESKGLHVNMTKTKFMASGLWLDILQNSGKFPCAVCRTGVGRSSIRCSNNKHWNLWGSSSHFFFFSESHSTLVQKNLCARKALCYKFRKVSMYVHNNIFHHLSRALNLLKLISKCMEIFVQCMHLHLHLCILTDAKSSQLPDNFYRHRSFWRAQGDYCNSDTVS